MGSALAHCYRKEQGEQRGLTLLEALAPSPRRDDMRARVEALGGSLATPKFVGLRRELERTPPGGSMRVRLHPAARAGGRVPNVCGPRRRLPRRPNSPVFT